MHNALNRLATHNTVKVMWIESHKGHWGNEMADTLAKEGTTSDNLVKGYLPQSLLKMAINNKVREQDVVSWSTSGHRHTKLTLGNKDKTVTSDLKKLLNNRLKYRAAVQLISGHAALNYYLNKITLVDTKICPHCEYAEETVAHFLGQCPAFAMHRGEILNTYYASLSDIFEDNSILKIARYAIKTKRFLPPERRDESGVT